MSDIFTYNSVIRGLVAGGRAIDALVAFDEMRFF
jgi:pentatricopeptide repeat protein